MSYPEAKEDGIHTEIHKGYTWYYPPCKICGAPVPSWNYVRGTPYTCPECRKLLVEGELRQKDEQVLGKKEKRLNRAIKRISKVADIEKYSKAIETVRKNLDRPQWFQSTEEIMTAMELVRRGVKAYHQVKVYDYRVDFVLPDYKVALEIDGELYHGRDREASSRIRDEAIANKFGDGWEVIHIRTENINMNVTRLLPAIKAVLKRRKKNKRTV